MEQGIARRQFVLFTKENILYCKAKGISQSPTYVYPLYPALACWNGVEYNWIWSRFISVCGSVELSEKCGGSLTHMIDDRTKSCQRHVAMLSKRISRFNCRTTLQTYSERRLGILFTCYIDLLWTSSRLYLRIAWYYNIAYIEATLSYQFDLLSVPITWLARSLFPSIQAIALFCTREHACRKMATITTTTQFVSGRPRYPYPGTDIGIKRRDVHVTTVRNQFIPHPGILMRYGHLAHASRISLRILFDPVFSPLPCWYARIA